ncbi:outer membrane protein transport protein [Weeksellaceae bacterium TAE3-ERU29]|nr:outer membrane protein transport protein [Weeksellaceae bacterium TAE3-ERU29]
MKKISFALFLSLSACLVYGGGYRVSLQGVRQAALGAQGVAMHHDASVAFFNPAALAFVESKVSIAVGGFGVGIKSSYQNQQTLQTAETKNPLGTPLYFAASYKPTKNLAVGVSVTTPFGSTIDWGNEWAGRYIIDRIALKSFFIQPTVAYSFNDWFSLGGGVIIARGDVNIRKSISFGSKDIGFEIDKKGAKGTGMNLGVFIKPSETLNIGASYRSEITMKAEEGDVIFKDVPAIASTKLPFTAKNFNSTLPLPAEFLIGANYQVTPKLMLGLEIGTVQWSAYKDLKVELYNGADVYNSEPSDKNYDNTVNYSFGAEYLATRNLAVRLGYKYDESPSPSDSFNPETPTVNYHAFTGGFGLNFNQFTIDAMAEYIYGEERSFNNTQYNFGGDIMSRGFVFGLGLSYNLNY